MIVLLAKEIHLLCGDEVTLPGEEEEEVAELALTPGFCPTVLNHFHSTCRTGMRINEEIRSCSLTLVIQTCLEKIVKSFISHLSHFSMNDYFCLAMQT